MPRDFKTFSNEQKKVNNTFKENKEKTTEYENIINKYKDMNQSDLMANLFKEATKLKNEGKLNSETLNGLKTTLSPFLNSDQQEMLNNLIDAINEQR